MRAVTVIKKHRNKIIAAAVIVLVLAAAWTVGGGYVRPTAAVTAGDVTPTVSGTDDAIAPIVSAESASTTEQTATPEPAAIPTLTPTAQEPTAMPEPTPTAEPAETPPQTHEPQASADMAIDPQTGKDKYLTDPVPEGKPLPVEPQNAQVGTDAYVCTLSVRCDTILDNIANLDPEKVELVPSDGVIFAEMTVTFYEGESVFNVLQREMKRHKIHMEFVNTPIYNSAYIEGINNLYEFDCGELSGWMYKVNGWFPNYGCSRYQLMDGDVIEWVYTCDLGRDVGGFYSTGG